MQQTKTAGNENTALLKYIALFSMLVDHAGAVFFPSEPVFRVIGRLAFPLYAWCLIVGAEYTRDVSQYALRLFLTGVISQPFFMAALHHPWYELNIFFTLLLSLMGITGIRLRKHGSHIWCPLLALLAACMVYVDYSWQGGAFILLLYAARKSRSALCAVMIAFCLYWGSSGASMASFLGLSLPVQIPLLPQASTLLILMRRIQFWAILALPWMMIPMNVSVRMPKWVSYCAYPGHLFLLILIRCFA